MPDQNETERPPTEADIKAILKALDASGVLKDPDSLTREEGKRRFIAEASREGLRNIHPDRVVCDGDHYFFVIPPKQQKPT
jgi:hypothetical protein